MHPCGEVFKVPKEIKRWKCNHCKKHFASRNYAWWHEKKCFFNTDNRTCPTCAYFNDKYSLENCKCHKLNRSGCDKESVNVWGTDEIVTNLKYFVFTEFLIYNCEHWKSKYEIEEDGSNGE